MLPENLKFSSKLICFVIFLLFYNGLYYLYVILILFNGLSVDVLLPWLALLKSFLFLQKCNITMPSLIMMTDASTNIDALVEHQKR